MSMLSSKKVWIIIIILLALAGGLLIHKKASPTPPTNQPAGRQVQNDSSARVVSTKPDPLEDTIIGANQPIEITFNKPLQNTGEFKSRIEPEAGYRVQLSGDRKTAQIIWVKPLELGTTYTFFIGTDTKFDGVGAWGQEKIYHFKTIKYTGV